MYPAFIVVFAHIQRSMNDTAHWYSNELSVSSETGGIITTYIHESDAANNELEHRRHTEVSSA